MNFINGFLFHDILLKCWNSSGFITITSFNCLYVYMMLIKAKIAISSSSSHCNLDFGKY